MTALLGPMAMLACLASGVGISRLVGRLRRGEPLVPPLPANPVSWDGLDVAALFVLFMACQVGVGVVVSLVAPTTAGDTPVVTNAGLAASAGAMLVFTLLGITVLRLRGAPADSLGFRDPQPAAGLRLAVGTWVIIVPPLLAVAAFLDRFVVSYSHPVVDFLRTDRSLPAVGLVVLTAVVAAPIAEEFFFRRVLQGWLETRLGEQAIVVSAVCFGLAHLGHGLGWIPLIGFGLATGYLARQRGTILPSIVVHALFNAVSVALLLLPPQAAAGGG
jgi:membrane protease YdiL (CAAX protease family)